MYAGHVGYGVEERHRGHRYAERALRLLSPVARRLGLGPLWVTCDPENVALRRTLERLGAELVEEVDVPPDCVIFGSGHPRKCRYRIDLDEGRGGGQVEATRRGEVLSEDRSWRSLWRKPRSVPMRCAVAFARTGKSIVRSIARTRLAKRHWPATARMTAAPAMCRETEDGCS